MRKIAHLTDLRCEIHHFLWFQEEGDVDLEAKKRKECERKTEISILRFDRVTKFLSKRGSLYFGFGANKRNNVRLISKMNTKQRSN